MRRARFGGAAALVLLAAPAWAGPAGEAAATSTLSSAVPATPADVTPTSASSDDASSDDASSDEGATYTDDAPPPPTSPGTAAAFLVLGSTPADIARPGSASDLALSIGAAAESAGAFPFDYAVEIRPFWLGTRAARALGLAEYARGGPESVLHNAVVSFGTSGLGGDDTTPIRAALAVQTTLWPNAGARTNVGRFLASWDRAAGPGALAPVGDDACSAVLGDLAAHSAWLAGALSATELPEVEAARTAASALYQTCAALDPAAVPMAVTACADAGFAQAPDPRPTSFRTAEDRDRTAEIQSALERLDTANAAAATALATASAAAKPPDDGAWHGLYDADDFARAQSACAVLLSRREGWAMDLALGGAMESADRRAVSSRWSDLHAWLTPGYLWERTSLFGLVRVRTEDVLDPELRAVTGDVGLALGRRWQRLTLTGQGAVGLPLVGAERPVTGRALVGADLQLGDNAWFSTALGAGFPVDEPASILSWASITFATDTERSLAPPIGSDLAAVPAE